MESLAQAVGVLQKKLEDAYNEIKAHQTQLTLAGQKVGSLERALAESRQGGPVPVGQTSNFNAPKKNKPFSFNGKGSVSSWCVQMDNYLAGTNEIDSLNIALSYLSGNAHEWWIVHSKSTDGSIVKSWTNLRAALLKRFETLNKEKIARDKLARWKQVKDVPTFNDDFNKIMLDIPDMGTKDQIDRYSRGLKPYIWKSLCTKEYSKLSDLMADAERVEAAFRRSGVRSAVTKSGNGAGNSGPEPMEIGNVGIKQEVKTANVEIKKLDKDERERCMREGLCLRRRHKGHLAKSCPKGQKN